IEQGGRIAPPRAAGVPLPEEIHQFSERDGQTENPLMPHPERIDGGAPRQSPRLPSSLQNHPRLVPKEPARQAVPRRRGRDPQFYRWDRFRDHACVFFKQKTAYEMEVAKLEASKQEIVSKI